MRARLILMGLVLAGCDPVVEEAAVPVPPGQMERVQKEIQADEQARAADAAIPGITPRAKGVDPAVAARVRFLLAEQLDEPIDRISPRARFAEDLKVDSLDAVEIVMALEDEFDVAITDAEAERLLTVEDVGRLMTAKAK